MSDGGVRGRIWYPCLSAGTVGGSIPSSSVSPING